MESPDTNENDPSDLVWGAAAIGREIDRTASQVYYLHAIGALEGAVAKLGHKTFVGSRKRLRNLPTKTAASTTKSGAVLMLPDKEDRGPQM
jgi:hypothetical protein